MSASEHFIAFRNEFDKFNYTEARAFKYIYTYGTLTDIQVAAGAEAVIGNYNGRC